MPTIQESLDALVTQTTGLTNTVSGRITDMDNKIVQASSAKSDAETAKLNAEIAETSAQTAQSLAETARDVAQDAKVDAQSAKSDALAAQSAAASSQNSAEAARDASIAADVSASTHKSDSIAAKNASVVAQGLAETAETNASSSASAANSHKIKAASWASAAEDTEVESGVYSAKHYAAKAALEKAAAGVSENNALASKNVATTKASEASASASTATSKAASADSAKADAETAKDAALVAKTAAETAKANAVAALSSATTKADEAAVSATNAAAEVNAAVTNLIGGAPGTLNTLNELAQAINDDASYASTLTTALAGKVDDSQVLTNVPAGALFTDTTYSVGDGGLTQKNFTTTLKSKLDGIASGATADQTKADIEALGIAASSITGALPAIDGSALTGIVTKSATAPASPASGDIWYNTSLNKLNTWDGYSWRAAGGVNAQSAQPTSNNLGDLWMDTDNDDLMIYNSRGWSLVSELPPEIINITFSGGSSYVDPLIPETVTLHGSNFSTGAIVSIAGVNLTTTVISSAEVTFETDDSLSPGTYDVKITNESGLTSVKSHSLVINGAPVFSTAANLGDSYSVTSKSVTANATDPESDAISYSFSSIGGNGGTGYGNAGMSINASSGSITGTTPDVNSNTIQNMTICATDSVGNITCKDFNYTALANRDPVWSTNSGLLGTATGGQAFSSSLYASDPEGQGVTYSVISGSVPSGLTLNASSGLINGTVSSSTGQGLKAVTSTSNFVVRATDGASTPNVLDRSFSINVNVPWEYRVMPTMGVVLGGYKDGISWYTVNEARYSNDTTYNRGDLMSKTGVYNPGMSSYTHAYGIGLNDSTDNSANTKLVGTIAFSNWSWSYKGAVMPNNRNHADTYVNEAAQIGVCAGGGTAAQDKVTFSNDSWSSVGINIISGSNTGGGGSAHNDTTAIFYTQGAADTKIALSNFTTSSIGDVFNVDRAKGMIGSTVYAWFFGGLGTSNHKHGRVSYSNGAYANTGSYPTSFGSNYDGETNECARPNMNQSYKLGGYNGVQHNLSGKTDLNTGTTSRITALDMKGHAGASSGMANYGAA